MVCSVDSIFKTDDTMKVYLDNVSIPVTDFDVTETVTVEELSNTVDPGKLEAISDDSIDVTFNLIVRTSGGSPVIHDVKAGSCYALRAYAREPDFGYIGDILILTVGLPVTANNKSVVRPVTASFQGVPLGPKLT
jgi:hypothetical protein